MFFIKIADVIVGIQNRYKNVEWLCRDYTVSLTKSALFVVEATEEEIAQEQKVAEMPVSPGYAESVCIYRNICKKLPILSNAYLFHSVIIEYEGKGYAFAAKSGTGKSTHAMLWKKKFGEKVHIVNGDKPILRFQENKLIAYGTPWCGKEGWSENTSVPLKGICFLERAPKNSIQRITPQEATTRMFHQILSPDNMESLDALFPLLDQTVTKIPCYVLQCNISEEAAWVAYTGMNMEGNEE